MTNIETAVMLKRELDALRPLAPEQEAKIWQKFRFDWNYHSNNIEGNSLTFGETKSLLLHNITAQGKPLKDHIEITGHNEAIHALISFTKSNEPLSEGFIRALHQLILRERREVAAITPDGLPTKKWIEVEQYKTSANHVQTATGETFRFAEPMDVPPKMHELVMFINDGADSTDAEKIITAAKVHYDFVLIHPFDDGNGRMARILMNLIFIKHGFPPAIIKTENKDHYYAALRQADGDQLDRFVEYIAGCVCASLSIMLAGARGDSIEEPDEQDRQIKMLAKLLEEKSGKLSTVRSLESVNILFNTSIAPLANALDAAARKFSPMYVDIKTAIESSNIGVVYPEFQRQLDCVKGAINENTSSFLINAKFSNLKFEGLDAFSKRWQIAVTLNPASYDIVFHPSNTPGTTLRKTYAQTISVEEINALVSQLHTTHMKAIEQASGVSLGKF
jgi:Fic family protein